jgi:hypothetical protein
VKNFPKVAAKAVQMPPIHQVGFGNQPIGRYIAIARDGERTPVILPASAFHKDGRLIK